MVVITSFDFLFLKHNNKAVFADVLSSDESSILWSCTDEKLGKNADDT